MKCRRESSGVMVIDPRALVGVVQAYFAGSGLVLDGTAKQIVLPLVETAWLKDPRNTQLKWANPKQCEFVEALASMSDLRILGDHTRWYESVGLDSVSLTIGTGGVPMACASIYY